MLREERAILWKTSATLLGVALPMKLFGPAIMAACLALGVIFGMLATHGTSLRSTMKLFTGSPLSRLVVAMLVAFAASVPLALDVSYAGSQWGQLAGMGLLAALLYIVLREMPTRHTEELLRNLCLAILVVMVLVTLDAFLQDERLSSALHGRKWQQVHRLNFVSSMLAVLLPFLWAWLIRRYRESETLAHWVSVPLSLIGFVTVFVCGGRAGWVAVTVAAGLFLWLGSRHHGLILHRRHWVAGVLAAVLSPLGYGLSRGFDVMKERLDVFGEALGMASGRGEIWAFAIQHFGDNPLVGIGLSNFRKLPLPEGGIVSNSHPHNFLIQLFLETGAVGTVAALVFMVYLLARFWRFAQGNLYGVAGVCSLVAFFTASLANTSIFQPWWVTFLVFPAVFAARIGWSERPMARPRTLNPFRRRKSEDDRLVSAGGGSLRNPDDR